MLCVKRVSANLCGKAAEIAERKFIRSSLMVKVLRGLVVDDLSEDLRRKYLS